MVILMTISLVTSIIVSFDLLLRESPSPGLLARELMNVYREGADSSGKYYSIYKYISYLMQKWIRTQTLIGSIDHDYTYTAHK